MSLKINKAKIFLWNSGVLIITSVVLINLFTITAKAEISPEQRDELNCKAYKGELVEIEPGFKLCQLSSGEKCIWEYLKDSEKYKEYKICSELAPRPCAQAGSLLGFEQACCAGLVSVLEGYAFNKDCEKRPPMIGGRYSFFCTFCGDGVCDKVETKCNCPADCDDLSNLKIIYSHEDGTFEEKAMYPEDVAQKQELSFFQRFFKWVEDFFKGLF